MRRSPNPDKGRKPAKSFRRALEGFVEVELSRTFCSLLVSSRSVQIQNCMFAVIVFHRERRARDRIIKISIVSVSISFACSAFKVFLAHAVVLFHKIENVRSLVCEVSS